MIKILSSSQTKELDEFTIKKEPIASIDLMERACHAFVDWFVHRFDPLQSILIVCGPGNNGGDGLGIARLLFLKQYHVKVILVQASATSSPDFKKNLDRLSPQVECITISDLVTVEFPDCDIVIDALFGSGLSHPIDGYFSKVIATINSKKAIRVAVDIPSGLFANAHSVGPFVHAHHTVSFQLPKLSFMLPQYFSVVGEWHIVKIGLNQDFIDRSKANNYLLDEQSIHQLIRSRKKIDHKGTFGHALIIAGSLGKIGANILATRAALRTGSGLVSSLTPQCGQVALQVAVPEAMTLVDREENFLSHVPDLGHFTSIGVGPGIGNAKRTETFLANLFSHEITPCVIDADALNLLSYNKEMQNLVSPNSILTPHPGEFRGLVGDWKDDFERLAMQRALADRLKSVVVLKGAHTSIAMPNGDVYFNNTGNPAMATGGSGDVLTGILTSLLAQGYPPRDAARIGVYLHGMAGDMASEFRHTIIASDIIEQIPFVLKRLTS